MLALLLAVSMLASGCLVDTSGSPSSEAPVFRQGASGEEYWGPALLEERILLADVIARVKLLSVSPESDPYDNSGVGTGSKDQYFPALFYRFEVLEYLKGSGAIELVAGVYDGEDIYGTKQGAISKANDLNAGRDVRWDDREAVIFLVSSNPYIPSTQQANHYWFGAIDAGEYAGGSYYDDYYTIVSRHFKRWLPAAPTSGASGASGQDEQRFLLDAPSGSGASGASVLSEDTPTITLAKLKQRIAEINMEVGAGDGSEAYWQCVYDTYEWERRILWYKGSGIEGLMNPRWDQDFNSGMPSGSFVFADVGEIRLDYPIVGKYWLEGLDKDLFTYTHPGKVHSRRPIPVGEYQVYFNYQQPKFLICDGYPDIMRTRLALYITVNAPPGTLHEAFFDPGEAGAEVGFPGASGVLEPAGFTLGSTATEITGLSWQNGSVSLTLSKYVSLDGYSLDFIALEGSVALSLSGDDAAADAAAGTLTWRAASQPWHDGDKLMLRIRQRDTASER